MLTELEQEFLESQGLSEEDVFDGRSLSKNERYLHAKRAKKLIILRDASKSKCGHRLTTRHGHCIECNTAWIAYARRNDEPAFVYIAGSRKLGCLKVGVTSDANMRRSSLVAENYGGEGDWELLFYAPFKRAGAVEHAAHKSLEAYAEATTYSKEGHSQEARELFRVDFQTAYIALASGAKKIGEHPTARGKKLEAHKRY